MEETLAGIAAEIDRHARPLETVPLATGLVRLGGALLLGAVIGLERELHDRPAGLRTHMMIALAAALFTLVGFELVAVQTEKEGALRYDPLRLIEAVTSGVAFLAAGSIIARGTTVKGITTGASMWLAGAIGLACGAGNLVLAAIATGLALAILLVLRLVETGALALATWIRGGPGAEEGGEDGGGR
jgi:putative Mg2+ transporter-C (MgtC) family protein